MTVPMPGPPAHPYAPATSQKHYLKNYIGNDTMNKWFEHHLISLIFGFVGIVFALVGAGFGWGYGATQQDIRAAEQISLVTAAELAKVSEGSPVALEGRVGEQNTSYVEGLVAYTASQYQGTQCDDEQDDDDDGDRECREVWAEIDHTTPPLWLDLPDGRVKVSNTDYQLLNEPQVWQTTDQPVADKTLEYRGFRRGNPVFVQGSINKGDGVTLNVDFLSGGNREDYLAGRGEEAKVLLFMGVIFGGLGLLFIVIAIGTALWMR